MNLGGWGNWIVTLEDYIFARITEHHTVPTDDLREHILSPNCWCKPKCIYHNTYSHNSLDGREMYEQGRKLQ